MPRINNPTPDDMCEYCGAPAFFIAVNSKKKRCKEKPSQCPGIVKKQNESRMNNTTFEERSVRAKVMNRAAIETLKEKHNDKEWLKAKSDKISSALKQRGGHSGDKNPMFGKTHSKAARKRMKESANVRDNTNIGKYIRTDEHRDVLSARMIDMSQSGKLKRTKDTKPELMFESMLNESNIPHTKQFLIQFGPMSDRFRHCYDFHLTGTNILVEIDGDYWHSRPEVIIRDAICEEIANTKQYRVIRFLQSELESNPQNVITQVKKLI